MDYPGIRVFLSGDVDDCVLKLKPILDMLLNQLLGALVLEQKQKNSRNTGEHRLFGENC
jgi:hypothetical protein